VGPKRINSRDRSPDSNTSKALLARKETIRGTEILPRKSKCSTKEKIVEKPCAYSGDIEGGNQNGSRKGLGQKTAWIQETHTFETRKIIHQAFLLGSKRVNPLKETRHCRRHASSNCRITSCRNGLILPGLDVWWALRPRVPAVDRV
jgi:hypothetical protein